MCFFDFLKFPMTFDPSAHFFTCLNEIPARPHFCKNALNNDKLDASGAFKHEKHVIFCILLRRGGLPSSVVHKMKR